MFVELLSDVFLMKVANELYTNYEELGEELGLKRAQVRQIIYDEREALRINFHILVKWKNGSTDQASPGTMIQKLHDVLSEIGRDDLVSFVEPGKNS